jgi:hypothetical protein
MMQYPKSIVSIVAKVLCIRFPGFLGEVSKKSLGVMLTAVFLLGCSNEADEEELLGDEASGRARYVGKLFLVDAVTNADITEIINDYSFSPSAINIRAESNATSVIFELSGAETHRQVENQKPFALKGDNSGNYNRWTPKEGDYTLKVTPYSSYHGKGTAGTPVVINFRVGQSAPEPESAASASPPPSTSGEDLLFLVDWNKLTISPKTNGYAISGLSIPSFINNIEINNIGSNNHIKHQIIDNGGGKVLKGRLIDDDPNVSGTSRAQMSVRLKDDLNKVHTRHRMFLHPDVAHMNNYPGGVHWFSIYEMWNERDPNKDGDVAGSARWNMNLRKDSATDKLYWYFKGEKMQPQSAMYEKIFAVQKNRTVPIPFGKWFTLEMYLERHNTNGRILWTIQEDGGEKQVLFDVRGVCTIYPNREDLQLNSVQAYKYYTDDKFMDYMRNAGKEFSVMYSDLRFLK